MTKFHINSNGVAAPCRATKGNCPFGGQDSHYDTIEEAQFVAEKNNQEQFGLISRINQINKEYKIPKDTKKEKSIDKRKFLENNHSLRKSGDVWVHLDEDEKVVGTMKEPVILIKNNGELLGIVDNDNQEIKNSITTIKTLNLMTKFGLVNQDNNINLYSPVESSDEYKNVNKNRMQDAQSYKGLQMSLNNRNEDNTDLFNRSEITDYFETNKTNTLKIVDYNPDVDDWENKVPHIGNFSIDVWKDNKLNIHQVNGKWAVVDDKGNLYARMNSPAVVVNFNTESIESIGELDRLSEECEGAINDDRFTQDNNKMLNRIALVEMTDKSNNLSHIRELLTYSWAFQKDLINPISI